MNAHLALRFLPFLADGEGGKDPFHNLPHPLRVGTAGVIHLDLRRGQQLLIPGPQALGSNGGHLVLPPQLVCPEALLPAHKLSQAAGGIDPFVVDLPPQLIN